VESGAQVAAGSVVPPGARIPSGEVSHNGIIVSCQAVYSRMMSYLYPYHACFLGSSDMNALTAYAKSIRSIS
jgi:hypothetical protein